MAIKEEIFTIKEIRENGEVLEINIQCVDRELHYPEGVRYSPI